VKPRIFRASYTWGVRYQRDGIKRESFFASWSGALGHALRVSRASRVFKPVEPSSRFASDILERYNRSLLEMYTAIGEAGKES